MGYKLLAISIAIAVFAKLAVSTRGLFKTDEREQMTEVDAIKTKYGDIFDCVDINKQPTLLHPLLKNHKIQLRPTSTNLSPKSSLPEIDSAKLAQLERGCPKGTVPIRRSMSMTKNLVTSFGQHSFRSEKNLSLHFSQKPASTGFDTAGIIINPDTGKTFRGASALVNIWQPKVDNGQASGAVIQVSNGMPGDISFIRVGWMVKPAYVGDNQPILYADWLQVNNGKVSGCSNIDCPGFVQTNPNFALGLHFQTVSQRNGPQTATFITLTLDEHRNWWLSVQNIDIGYFPGELFSRLANGADATFWGGIVYSPFQYSPPMGSGYKKKGGPVFGISCFMNNVRIVRQDDGYNRWSDPDPNSVQKHNSQCYLATKNGYRGDEWRYSFFFNGAGGDFGRCH